MTGGVLTGCRIIVAEDEYLLASDAARLLQQAGATVIGPVGTLGELQDRIAQDGFDVAILDIRLDGRLVYPVADLIHEAGAPFAFFTGYDEAAIPVRFAGVPRCQKPCTDETLIEVVRQLHAGRPGTV